MHQTNLNGNVIKTTKQELVGKSDDREIRVNDKQLGQFSDEFVPGPIASLPGKSGDVILEAVG